MAIPYSIRPQLGGLLTWLLSGFKGTPKSLGVSVTIPLSIATLPTESTMTIAQILAALSGVNALLPEVIKLIQAIETAFPNATVDAKLAQVIAALNSFENLESEVSSPLTILSGLVTGLFHSGATSAAAAPSPAPAA